MACNLLGTFAIATDAKNLCYSAQTFDLYGPAGLSVGDDIFADSSCTISYANSYFSDGSDVYYTNGSGLIESISGCCSTKYCIQNDTTYDDNYQLVGVYNDYPYFTGITTGYFIYYSTVESRWCLAQNLGDPCDQFGPYGSTSECPDFDDTVGYDGICLTTTTTVDPCATFDFAAIFDCLVTPSPSLSATPSPTPTPTPTPSSTNICGGSYISASAITVSYSPTPTMTPTPTPTPEITRPCNFSGEVIFNTFDEILQCANSKKFKDCFTGLNYFSSDLLLVSGNTKPKEGYVYNAIINGQGHCVLYEGLFENISGVDNIILTNEVGSQLDGACLECLPNLTQTPTPSPTQTPTPTPTSSPCIMYQYYVSNNNPSISITVSSNVCGDKTVITTVTRNSSVILCSIDPPTTTFSNVQIVSSGFIC